MRIVKGNRRYRKSWTRWLRTMVDSAPDVVNLRVGGSAGNWHLYVKTDTKLQQLTGVPYRTKTIAIESGEEKFGVRPVLVKVA